MSVKKFLRGETWYLRGTVRGQAIYESTGTSDPKAAEAIRIKRENDLLDASIYGKQVVATFADAVTSYLDTKPRQVATKANVKRLLMHFKIKKLKDINQSAVDEMCKALIRPGSGTSPAITLIATLSAILEHAARRGMCGRPMLDKPKALPAKTHFLYPQQAAAVVRASPLHQRSLVAFLFSVGCRPGEATRLDWSQVDLRGGQATLTLGKVGGKEHVVFLRPVAKQALSVLPHRHGAVFRTSLSANNPHRPIGPAYASGDIGVGWTSACLRAKLPGSWVKSTNRLGVSRSRFVPQHVPYGMRHSFATWHYCVHRDLQMLRDEVGWTTTRMAERYGQRMSVEYQQDVKDWWDGKVDLGLAEVEAVSCKIRAAFPAKVLNAA